MRIIVRPGARRKGTLSGVLGLFFCAGAMLFAVSCSPSVVMTVRPDAGGTASFSSDLTPTAENLLRRLSPDAGPPEGPEQPAGLYDREKIRASLAHAGFRADSIEFPGRTAIRMGLSFAKTGNIPANAVSLDQKARSVSITLSRETIAATVGLMPAETREYLDLLMAPVLTGENLTAAEYTDLIASAYGKTIASELAGSALSLTIRAPAPVVSATANGTAAAPAKKGQSATFAVPLAEILAPSGPIVLRAAW